MYSMRSLRWHFSIHLAPSFSAELEQFLLLARELRQDPLRIKGSYAGALGVAQFLPSSYRRYAVDFDNDGRADLWNDDDAIGSVANYMSEFGWEPDGLVAVPADADGERVDEFIDMGWKPAVSIEALTHAGITPQSTVPYETEAALLKLQGEDGPLYYLGFNNFYVITRYNRSVNYAMFRARACAGAEGRACEGCRVDGGEAQKEADVTTGVGSSRTIVALLLMGGSWRATFPPGLARDRMRRAVRTIRRCLGEMQAQWEQRG